ncbi:NAD(P)/FAD-dependent oxidoreductase [Granulicella sp. dw_53]|uniref:NAD(P)/FAD-dependent oxidoreductase n=1 Tax=Granulicella sp. dw_53 TaxID=2719792 RepID=UPI001BD5C3ED|nr:NAD(P)/FAD-dependent oxidoreductase [Granulicella sp. dw_53]
MYSQASQSVRSSTGTDDPDVFIAGGGPAGLACAIAAAQRGLTVEVADGMVPPIDKACGEGLMPDTLVALTRLGLDLRPTESAIFRGIRFLTTDRSGRHLSTEATFPQGEGRGIRRILLHQLLLDRATALGVRLSWQTVVQGIESGQGSARSVVRTNRHTVRPRFIIGADGHQSLVRAWAGLERSTIRARRIGLRQHFSIDPTSVQRDFVEVHWSDYGQAYVTPVSPTEICIAFVADHKFPSIEEALSHFPVLQQSLQAAVPSGSPRGSITLSRKLHRVTDGNIALIGDASGSVDAVTGEGLGLCFRQALALGDALEAGDLALYQRDHRALQRLPHFMARTLLLLDHSPRLRNRTLRAFQRRPPLFQQHLGVHVGDAPVRIFGSKGLLATLTFVLAG